jgi:hypothetical protein
MRPMCPRPFLISALLTLFWLPQQALPLWSPEPEDPRVIDQVSAFGEQAAFGGLADKGYVLPGDLRERRRFGGEQRPEHTGGAVEIVRLSYLSGQGRQTFSLVDVDAVIVADERRAQRELIADRVSISEPALGGLLLGGLLALFGFRGRGGAASTGIRRRRGR